MTGLTEYPDLKQCPFCGADAENHWFGWRAYIEHKDGCWALAQARSHHNTTKHFGEEEFSEWNMRPTPNTSPKANQ